MTPDELREKVMTEMAEAVGAVLDADDRRAYLCQADAAIAVVLEEAARVCEHLGRIHRERGNIPGAWSFAGCEDCAAAIRALNGADNG